MLQHILDKLSPEMIVGLIVAGVVLVFFASRRPEICFALGFPAYLFLDKLKESFPISTSAATALFPLIAIVGSLLGNHRFSFGRCERIVMALALLMVCSVSYSGYSGYGQDKAALFCFMVVPVIIFAPNVITSVESLRSVVSVIFVSLVIYVFASGLLSLRMQGIQERVAALGDVTRAGQFFGLTVVLGYVSVAFAEAGVHKNIFYRCTMALSFLLLLRTGIRAAVLGIMVTIVLIYAFTHTDWFRSIIQKVLNHLWIIVFTMLILIPSLFFLKEILPQSTLDRFTSIGQFFDNFTPDEVRYWRESGSRTLDYFSAVEAFLSHPLLGVGAGGFKGVLLNYDQVRSNEVLEELTPVYPHNLILEFAAEQGICGLILICYVLYLNFKMASKLRSSALALSSDQSLICYCISIYIYGLFVSMTAADIPRMMILWWGMGLLLAATKIYNPSLESLSQSRGVKQRVLPSMKITSQNFKSKAGGLILK